MIQSCVNVLFVSDLASLLVLVQDLGMPNGTDNQSYTVPLMLSAQYAGWGTKIGMSTFTVYRCV